MHIQTSDQPQLNIGFGDYTINWGTHVCGLYESDSERDDIIFGYLNEGAKKHDLQLYCPVERTIEDFHSCYAEKYPCDCHDTHDEDIFIIQSAKELYYPSGTFSPWDMDVALNAFFDESQKNGERNIRGTAEMSWALEAIPGAEYLMAYESRLNYFIPGKPWISICMYNVRKFSGETIMGVLRTHPFTINGGIITQNPYYEDPDAWLAKNAPQFMSR